MSKTPKTNPLVVFSHTLKQLAVRVFVVSKLQITKPLPLVTLTPIHRTPTSRSSSRTPQFALLIAFCLMLTSSLGVYTYTRVNTSPTKVSAATTSTMNFQARLMASNGSLVPDGNYHIQFKLYNVAAAGTALWTETYTTGNLIQVKNGYLSVPLGSLVTFPTTINWDQELWLTMNIGGMSGTASYDGEMSPRIKLTSVPFAFAADQLSKTSGAFKSTLSLTTPTANRTITAPDASGVICLTTGNCAGVGGGGAYGDILQGGNSFGTTMTIGTNDNQSLVLETQGAPRISITGAGAITVAGATTFSSTLTASSTTALNGTTTLGASAGLATLRGADYTTVGSTNDVNFGTGTLFRLTGASAQTITGIAGGTDGRRLTLVNAAATTATLSNNSASSVAANRITTGTGSDLSFPIGASIELVYDAAASLWRVPSAGGGGSGICTSCANQSLSNLASVAINTSLLTGADNTIDLGSAAFSWRSLYADTSIIAPLIDTAGTLSLGTTTATAVTIGRTGTTTTNNGALTVTQATTLSGGLTVTNGASIQGNTSIATLAGNTLSIGNTTGALTVTGSSASTFVLNGVTVTAAQFNLLSGKDVPLVDTNDAVNTAITGTGALGSGSIGTGFGVINNADTITGTTLNGTTGINTGAGTGTQRIDSTGNLVNINNATIGGALGVTGNTNTGSLSVDGNLVLDMPSSNPERGPYNPIWSAVGSGRPLYADEEFSVGNNSVAVYNNSGGGAVTVVRETGITGVPNSTTNQLKVSYDGIGATSPGYGGVILTINPAANKTFVQRIRAKVPVGKTLVIAENSQGTNNTSYWLTNTAGTGKWEDYLRVSHAGNTGTFSGGGHVYITGGSGAFDWYIASMNVYEVNSSILSGTNTWYGLQTFANTINLTAANALQTSGTTRLTAAGVLQNVTNADAGTFFTGGTLGVARGGTGLNTYTVGDLLYANGAASLARLTAVASGSCLISQGVGTAPIWGPCSTGGGITGSGTNGQVTYFNGTSTVTSGANLLFNGTTLTANTLSVSTGGLTVTAGGASVTGTTTINTTGTAATSIGNATGTLAVTGNASSTFVLNGVTVTAAQFNLLSGKDAPLVDTNDATNTAITGTGALGSGSITSGFGTINNADTITGTTLNGTTGINTGAGVGTQRIDASGNLVNINNITAGGTLAVTGNATFDTNTLFVDATNNRVGIGNVAPNTALDVSGSISRAQNSTRVYKNVYAYNISAPTQTGTIVLTAPKGFTNTMLRFTINGYDYSGSGAWSVTVAGYAFTTTPAWINTSTEITGNAPFNSVRLGYDGTDVVIMLGTTTTVWQYPKVVIEEIVAGHSSVDDWGNAWSGALVTDETTPINYTNIVTPTVRSPFIQGGNSFGTTATLGTNDAQSLILETANTARLTITSAGAATFSGALTVSGLLQGTAGASITGNTTIATTAGNTLSLGNSTGALTVTGSSASTFVLNGVTVSTTEFNLLNGRDTALVDTTDAVTTAITGTGALGSGSITSGFGTINNADTITGTTLNGTTGINTGAGAGTQRIDASGNLVNIGTYSGSGTITTSSTVQGTRLIATVATGTAPLTVSSTTQVANLNVEYLGGYRENQLAQNLRSNNNISGGGNVTYNGAGIGWTTRFIVISNGNGADFSTSGYYDIAMPADTTVITGVGGAANATVSGGIIPLSAWQALYYILPIGGSSASVNANFRVASYTSALQVPSNWVLIAIQNPESGVLKLSTGVSLRSGQTTTSGSINNAIFNTSVSSPQLIATVATGTAPLTVTSTTQVNNLNVQYLGGVQASQFIRSDADDTTTGRLAFSGTSNGQAYNLAPIEIIEAYSGGAGLAPRLAFHYSGSVASQIGFVQGDSSGDIAALNNPGTGYEDFRAATYLIQGTAVIDGSRNIVNAGSGAFSSTLTATGYIRSAGELQSTSANAARFVQGNYGTILRNDGADTYLLLTASGDQYGGWNTLRPFQVNNATGNVGIGNNTLYVQHAGNVGIGTTGPGHKLDVQGGNVNTSGTYKINGVDICTSSGCTGTPTTLQGGYTASTGGTTPEIKLDATRGGLDVQDANTTINNSLLTVRSSNGAGLGSSLFDVNSNGRLSVAGSAVSYSRPALAAGIFALSSQPSGYYPVTASATAIATGDLNGDGYDDIVTRGNSVVSVLINNGGNGFNTNVDYATNSTVNQIFMADFNTDGRRDVLVMPTVGQQGSLLLGNGDGTLQARLSASPFAINSATQYTIADFNKDGRMDVGAIDSNGATKYFRTYLSTGTAFNATANATVSTNTAASISTADFNNDTYPDLITCVNNDQGVYIGFGQASGIINSTVTYVGLGSGGTGSCDGVRAGDFNGDGNADFMTNNWFNETAIAMYGNGAGVFGSRLDINITDDSTFIGEAVDLNNDGKTDLVFYNNVLNKVTYLISIGSSFYKSSTTHFPSNGNRAYGKFIDSPLRSLANAETGTTVAIYSNVTPPAVAAETGTVATLSVRTTNAAAGGLFIQAANSQTASLFAILNATGGGLLSVDATGNLRVKGSVNGGVGSPDYAENISVSDSSIEAADVVTMDPNRQEWVIKSSTSYDQRVVGVISTNPGFVTNATAPDAEDGTQRPLALSGRVPVKFSTENGSVQAGDYLTSSSIPGHAMKATQAGPTIGRAMEAFDETQDATNCGTFRCGKVLMFIDNTYYNPTDGNNIQGADMTLSGDLEISGNASISGSLNVSGATNLSSLTVTGDVSIKGNLVVAGDTSVQNITVNGHIITGGEVPEVEVLDLDTPGTTLTVDGNDTAGTITIVTGMEGMEAGDLFKTIFKKSFTKTPRIILSPLDDASADARIYPSSKTVDDYILRSSQPLPANQTYVFDYFIIE